MSAIKFQHKNENTRHKGVVLKTTTMESTHVISITNGEENVAPTKNAKTFQFSLSLPPVFSRLRENKLIQFSLFPITSYLRQKKDTKKIIHSIKVGISLVLISLLYFVDPLYEQVGDNAIWAIMTVVVTFEFSAGATLGKGLNRGMGTILGGGLGCIAAVLAQNVGGGIGNSIIIGTSVFIFGTIATYCRLFPSVKKRYDYGVMIFILTFNLVVVSGVRIQDQKVWKIASERLLTIVMGFVVCICVSFLVFPLWASDELHDSTVSRFQHLANALQGCLEEYVKFATEKENKKAGASFTVCKSLLDSKSKDEMLANFAKWEPWHGKFGFFYPWEKYLKIGEVLRELAAIILALGGCLQASTTIAAIENIDALAVASFVFLLKKVVDKVEELAKEVEQVGDIAGFRAHSSTIKLIKDHKKMGIPSEIAAAAIGLLCLWSVADSVPNTNITVILCNVGAYTSGDPFAVSLSYVVRELETETPTRKNYDYYNISPYPNAFAYGHAACNLNLTATDCKTCLGASKTAMFNGCPKRVGARSVLHDCTIRYEQYPFDD
ncbi:Aluminum-activated malate transporter 12 [Glycine soja]